MTRRWPARCASPPASHYILPAILARLRAEEPRIEIELVPSDTTENLLFREADIAVRMYRPEQLDVVTRKVAEFPIGLYAARTYVARRGVPAEPAELARHDLVGYDRSSLMIRAARRLGWELAREAFAVRCDNQSAHWELVRAGCGIGGGLCVIGDADPGLVRIL
ncbi:MAG TPA: LysR substrate-binding domain-containing protein, partial [Paracoccaceae bacterium]|nr:LysR substrate-binding domain-containing protein [Paracoccaceae bacterium]